jgi:hypothetical protein
MAFGLRGPIEGRNKDKVGLDRTLFRRGQQLWEILQRCILDSFFLRVGGLLEGGVMGPKWEAVTVTETPRGFLIQIFEDYNIIKT